MNKLGSRYGDYENILAIGKKVYFNFFYEDWLKGDFWNRSISYHDDKSYYMNVLHRTYGQQIREAINANCTEIYIGIETSGVDLSGVDSFITDIIETIRYLGYESDIIIGSQNEPLELYNFNQIYNINSVFSETIYKYSGVRFAVGEMATDFLDYYESFDSVEYYFDYISFHTDNNCSLDNFKKFFENIRRDKLLILNEHYHYNGSQRYGYNNKNVVNTFKNYTLEVLGNNRIVSVYICLPYGIKGSPFYEWLFLNKVDVNKNIVYSTKAWEMLKEIERKEVYIMQLQRLAKGSTGIQVRGLQKCLLTLNYYDGKIDGDFGTKTEAAVIKFNDERFIGNHAVASFTTWFEMMMDVTCEHIIKSLIEVIRYIS